MWLFVVYFSKNIFLRQSQQDVDKLIQILVKKGMFPKINDNLEIEPTFIGLPCDDCICGVDKKTTLVQFLAIEVSL
jgi:hypothetical protein